MADQFKPGEKEWQSLANYAQKDTIQLAGVAGKDKAIILERMQILMARQIWRNEGYFEVANKNDVTVLKALTNFKD